jgi:hypothetical protein
MQQNGRELARGRPQTDGAAAVPRRAPSAAWWPRHRRPNVAGRGRASRGCAGDGQASKEPRGVEESGVGSASSSGNGWRAVESRREQNKGGGNWR